MRPERHPPPSAPNVHRLVASSAMMAMAQATGVLTVIAATPFVIDRLGPDGYGAWELLLVFQGVALIFHNVISGTLIWRLSLCCGEGNHRESQRLIRVACGIVLGVVAVIGPLTLAASPAIVSALGLHEPWASQLRTLMPTMLSVALLSGINQSLLALITAYQQAGRAAATRALGGVLSSAIAIGMLLGGYGVLSLVIGTMIGSLGVLLLSLRVARRLVGKVSVLPTKPTRADIGLLGPFAGMLLISNLTLLARDHTDKLLAAGLGGLGVVADLALAGVLASLALQVSAVMLTPFTAAAGVLQGRGDWTECVLLCEKVGRLVAMTAGTALFVVFVLRAPLLMLWVGEPRGSVYPYLTLLLVAGFLAIAYSGVGVALAKAIGRPGIETEYALVTLALVVITKPVLASLAGPAGAVASSTLSWGIGSAYLAFIVASRLGLPRRIVHDVNQVVLATMLLAWVAAPRISELLPVAATRVQAVWLLLAVTPLVVIAFLACLLVMQRVLNWASHRTCRPVTGITELALPAKESPRARAA